MNILIVDDDVSHGRSVRDLLAAHNYPADVATSGQQGLARLREAHQTDTPIQVLILDLNIPDLSGVDILRAIANQRIQAKTIVLSGENELATVTPILRLGAMDYLRKPFQAQQLITSVANALARFQLEEENAKMQRQAEESARLYEFLLNASPDLIYMLDEQGRFKFINRQLDHVFNIQQEQLRHAPWHQLFTHHPGLVNQLRHKLDERRTGVRATLAEEFEFHTDIGTRHSLELSAIGLYEGRSDTRTGDFIGTYGVIRDVTETRRTRRQLQQSQRKFYSLFVDSPDAVFIARLENGEILERNPNFDAICEALNAAQSNQDDFLWTASHSRAQFVAALQANPDHHDAVLEHHINDEYRYFEIRARQLELEGQLCMIATVRDRSYERRAEQDRLNLQSQLQQAGRMEAIGQVAGGIAHDFNNILASIIGYAELVMNARGRLSAPQVDQYLDEVVTAGHRARDLISQMLTFTRAQRGEAAATDITKTIQDVSRMLRAAIPTTIEVDTQFEDEQPIVLIDPVQLQQIVINLLINARDAIEGTGQIRLLVRRESVRSLCQTCGEPIEGEYITVSVTDSGHGIPDALLDKIFEMYFTTREPDQGTGFGLWMINNLVHEHQGHIRVDSQQGIGSTFVVYLPAVSAQPEISTTVPVAVPQISGRILVVDDEVSVANFIGEVLRDKGYPTIVFTESPQALDYLKSHMDDVALLLTDGAMPLISGLELAEFARSKKPALPIVFITGYAQNMDTQRLNRIGVNTFLQKPFSIEEMLSAVGAHTQLQTLGSVSET